MSDVADSSADPVLLDGPAVARLATLFSASKGGNAPPVNPPNIVIPSGPGGDYGIHPRIVTSATSLSTNKWKYGLKRVAGGGTSHHGLLGFGDADWGRNTFEELAMAGYAGAGITGLYPIHVGAIVLCWWSRIGDAPWLLFNLPNQAICTPT